MNGTDFFSSNHYIYLPTFKNPKVILVVDEYISFKHALKLYNPFSLKGKLLRSVAAFFCIYSHFICKILLSKKKEKSNFIDYLESKLGTELLVSIYLATAKDKVVLQLQSKKDNNIIGYVKYPLNDIGELHLQNEIKAIEILSQKGIVEPYMMKNQYNGNNFLLLKELEGNIDIVSGEEIYNILERLKKEDKFSLNEHPRILQLKEQLNQNKMLEYIKNIDNICKTSKLKYFVVYEHGDFTPWNIVKVGDKYFPFDFEYFIEDGLEYLDSIKYYYQIGRLLESKRDLGLVKYIQENLNISEFKELFQIFLIKEIYIAKEENNTCIFEENLLKVVKKL